MCLHKLALASEAADIGFRTHTEVLVFVDKQPELIGEVGEILIIRRGREKKHVAVLTVDKLFYVAISTAFCTVAEVMAFIDYY